MRAPLPPDEPARITALRRYAILDTAEEEAFNRITRLAGSVFQAPVAAISLIDENRVWFKSRINVDICEADRDISFCAHAILGETVFVVPDATADRRFADYPAVLGDPGIRFYAGAPICTPDGYRLGTLCVADFAVRDSFGPSEARTLADLASLVIEELEHRRTEAHLKVANNELEQFAYAAAHDLQEPLRQINIYTQLLLRRHEDVLNADARECSHLIRSGVGRMESLIHDLLSYSRSAYERLTETGTTDAHYALTDALEKLEGIIKEGRAEVRVTTELPTVCADRAALTQVFHNLLSNALKYCKPGVIPKIEVSAVKKEENWIFSVCDHGIGFSPEYAEQIFGLFRRLHTAAAYPGTGIGLAVVKRLVERHGGKVWADSEGEGRGSAFRFSLPA